MAHLRFAKQKSCHASLVRTEAAYMREQFILRSYTLPLQGGRKKAKPIQNPLGGPSEMQRSRVHARPLQIHKWHRSLPTSPLHVNVDILMAKTCIPRLVSAGDAQREDTGMWKRLAWAEMCKLGVPDTPPCELLCAHLWTCKVATRGTKVCWSCFWPALLVRMRRLAELLTSPARRAKAVERINAALRRKHLHPLSTFSLVLPDASHSEAVRVRRIVHEMLDSVGSASPLHKELALWWKLLVLRGKPITLLDKVVNHRACARAFESVKHVGKALESSLVFLDENLNIPQPPHSRALVAKWVQPLEQWAQRSNFAGEVVADALKLPMKSSKRVNQHGPGSRWWHVFARLCCKRRTRKAVVEHLPWREWLLQRARPRRRSLTWRVRELRRRLLEVEIVAQQDKCPAAVVGMKRVAYERLLHETFLQDPVHYEVLHATPEHVAFEQYQKHVDVCPAWARRRYSAWTAESLPNAYINIKRKCFDTSGCVCSKAHAHVREIIANTSFPLKTFFQELSRAIQCMIKHCGLHTWEVWSLKDAPTELKKRFDDIHPRICSCVRCGASKPPVATFQADVNQLFKDVEPLQVLAHLQDFVQACERSSHVAGVTVLKSKRHQAFLGGTPLGPLEVGISLSLGFAPLWSTT